MRYGSGDPLVPDPPDRALQTCIVVPARNEEELLPSALRSLAEQNTKDGRTLSHELYEVILLINNSTDRSTQIARSFRKLYPTLRLHVVERTLSNSKAHIGHVRRLLMDEACRRLDTVIHPGAAILSTDADSQVAPNWICQNHMELARGAEAVGGRIVVLPCEQDLLEPSTRLLHRYDHLYRRLVSWVEHCCDPEDYDPWPRHHHHFGASLAVTPRIYKAVGRLPPRRTLEDVAFHTALVRHDVRLRHSNHVRVFTSARLIGRARYGLSGQLRGWQECGKEGMRSPVETGRFLEHLFETRRQLRLLWLDWKSTGQLPANRLREFSARSGINLSEAAVQIRTARYFGSLLAALSFYKACRRTWPDCVRLAPLKYVVDELQERFSAEQRNRRYALARQAGNDPYASSKAGAIPGG